MVAQPWRRAETLVFFFRFLCGPFAARGATGEAEYPTRWLGGTGEPSVVGKRERGTRQGARDAAQSSGHLPKPARGNGMKFTFC